MLKKSLADPAPALACFLLVLLLTNPGWAKTPLGAPTLTAEAAGITAGDSFGWPMRAQRTRLLVSTRGDLSCFPGGALYVYQRDRISVLWHQILEILPEQADEEIGKFATDGEAFSCVTYDPKFLTGSDVHIREPGLVETLRHDAGERVLPSRENQFTSRAERVCSYVTGNCLNVQTNNPRE